MTVQSFLANVSGIPTSTTASQTSAGAGSAGKIPALNASGVLDSTIVNSTVASAGAGSSGQVVALNASGKLDTTVLPTGVGAETATVTTSEAIAAGAFVNIWNNSGVVVRNADSTTSGKQAHGFVLSAFGNGVTATVYFAGINTAVTGQTPGQVWLGTVGAAVSTAPSTTGNLVQPIGTAISSTAIAFEPGMMFVC